MPQIIMDDIELSIDEIEASILDDQIDVSHMSKIYSPLPTQRSIRLLTILPGELGDTIQSTLEVVELDKASRYEALSYVWGQSDPPAEIVCNGERMQVTPNLGAGLQRLRYPKSNISVRRRYSENDLSIHHKTPDQSGPIQPERTGPRRIWVDAICINQQDLRERSQQVSIMRDIYRLAADVVIWLGEDNGQAAAAIDFMEKIANLVRKQTGKYLPASAEIDPADQIYKILYNSDATYLIAAMWFFDREWFRRVWIVQEVAYAKHPLMVIGHLSVGFLDVALSACWLFAGTLQGFLNLSKNSTEKVERVTHILKSRVGGPLPLLLLRTWQMDATDSRDKIYALLGLSSPWEDCHKNQGQNLAITPDYSRTLVEVYSNVVRKFLSRPKDPVKMEGVLGVILFFKSHHESEEVDSEHDQNIFPSWMPRWDKKHQVFAPLSLEAARSKYCTPSGDSVITMNRTGHPRSLILKGIIITCIDTVHQLSMEEAPTKLKFVLFDLLCIANEKAWAYQGTDAIHRAMAVTVSAGGTKTIGQYEPYNEKDLHNYFKKDSPSKADLDIFPSKMFFFTTDGHMGIGTEGMQPGDEICMIFGGEILCVIRPRGGHHVLVGECFVHGYMHGEVMERWKTGQCKDQ